MSATLVVPFTFGAVILQEACWISGKPYFTRRAIGEWLGYPQPNQAIRNIIKRNPHAQDPRWSVVVKLTTTDGKQYDHEVYDPIGLQLIVFESRQPKAIEYKIAVANLVWAHMTGQIKPPHVTPELGPILMLRKWSRPRAEAVRALAAAKGWSVQRIRCHLRRVEGGRPPVMTTRGMRYVHLRWRGCYEQALALRRTGLKLREVSERLGPPISTISRWGQPAETPQLPVLIA